MPFLLNRFVKVVVCSALCTAVSLSPYLASQSCAACNASLFGRGNSRPFHTEAHAHEKSWGSMGIAVTKPTTKLGATAYAALAEEGSDQAWTRDNKVC
eukprot:4271180-Amphidinium_carterae.1